MEYIKKIVHILSMIIYIMILLYALIWLPTIFGYRPLVVLSGSMEPTFKVGSIVYYKNVSQNEIKVNDIITFKEKDAKLVSHRVYDITDNQYITKGDANNSVDALKVDYSKIVGKDLEMNILFLGYYVNYINNHLYLLIFVVIILSFEFIFSNNLKNGTMKEGEKKYDER